MAIVHTIGISCAGGSTNIPQKNLYASGIDEANIDGFFASGSTSVGYAVSSGKAQSLIITADQPIILQLNQSGGSLQSGGYSFAVPAGGITLFLSGFIGSQPFSGNVTQGYVFVSGSASISGANVSVRTNTI